jgi:hypothetical protein
VKKKTTTKKKKLTSTHTTNIHANKQPQQTIHQTQHTKYTLHKTYLFVCGVESWISSEPFKASLGSNFNTHVSKSDPIKQNEE